MNRSRLRRSLRKIESSHMHLSSIPISERQIRLTSPADMREEFYSAALGLSIYQAFGGMRIRVAVKDE